MEKGNKNGAGGKRFLHIPLLEGSGRSIGSEQVLEVKKRNWRNCTKADMIIGNFSENLLFQGKKSNWMRIALIIFFIILEWSSMEICR